jgi:capsular exopolysaccharide synthesis family protein
MSKIYEALRQAELDRANRPSTQSDSATSISAQAVLDAPPPALEAPAPTIPQRPLPISRPVSTLIVPDLHPKPAEPTPVHAAKIDEIAGAPIEAPAFDLTGVRSYTWNPSLNQLPALMERGAAVEQFRSLRSRMYEFRDLNTLKSILVSSGLPQEGKSFVAANLAISFGRHKAARVLLIDGDMRRATLHKLFGCSGGPGLTEYLAGKSTISDIMQRPKPTEAGHPLPNGLSSLTFIPGGTEHNKAADLSGNRRFDRLIEAVSPFFDWIIVDSSPVNLVSDGVNLARACDAALLVARGAVTKYEVAQRAMTELKATKILGFVLNAVENPTVAQGYYGYDGYDKDTE